MGKPEEDMGGKTGNGNLRKQTLAFWEPTVMES